MGDPQEMWEQWLTLVGSAVGMPCPGDGSEDTLKKYYQAFCLLTHPDKQPLTMEPRQKDRMAHFFTLLSGVHETYTKHPEAMRFPDAAMFDYDEEPVDHDHDSVPPASRSNHSGKRVYLVTFSHSGREGRRTPAEFNRREFGELVIRAFESSVPSLRVVYCAVFQEKHASASASAAQHVHFHVSVKSSRQHNWAPMAEYLRREHGVYVHFATSGSGYCSAFRYGWWPTNHKPLSELDREFELLDGTEQHPTPSEAAKRPIWGSRKRRTSSERKEEGSSSQKPEAEEEGGKEYPQEPKGRREAVRAYAFRLIHENKVTSGDSFLALAQKLGDPRLVSLFMTASATTIVERAQHALEAETRIERSLKSRLDILKEAASSACVCEQHGKWKMSALDLLRLQKIAPARFAAAVVLALERGASKGANVFIFGSTTSGKSWILDPLRSIYRCHLTPAPSHPGFPLQDLPVKEVILWQDFRRNEDMLPWASLLLLFEGTEITIRRPRTEFMGDLDYKVTQPVFLTSKGQLEHGDPEEEAMMARRFEYFCFAKTVPPNRVRKIAPCSSCFASMCLPFTESPLRVPALTGNKGYYAEGSDASPSQGSSSSDTDLPRASSGCGSELLYCENCGQASSSSPFCRATGRSHE